LDTSAASWPRRYGTKGERQVSPVTSQKNSNWNPADKSLLIVLRSR
jgi:hypothetical protein